MKRYDRNRYNGRSMHCEYVLPYMGAIPSIKSLSKEAKNRLKWFDFFYSNSRNASLTCRHFGIARKVFYYWKKRHRRYHPENMESMSTRPKHFRKSKIPSEIICLIIKLRKENPCWSKYKLAVLLKRDHKISYSASTIGRIIKRHGLIDLKASNKRKRASKGLKPRAKGTKYKFPGSHVEVDTKHVYILPGVRVFQFTAIDSVTKQRVIRVYSAASSRQASIFIEDVVKTLPFKVINIQTDNGSEFAGEFKSACQKLGINHYFIYAYCPDMNALVERSHRTDEEEFYMQGNCAENLEEQKKLVKEWEFKYNNIRPHQSLGYLTPNEYYDKIKNLKVLPM